MKSSIRNFFVAAFLIVASLEACSSEAFPTGTYIAERTGAQLEFN